MIHPTDLFLAEIRLIRQVAKPFGQIVGKHLSTPSTTSPRSNPHRRKLCSTSPLEALFTHKREGYNMLDADTGEELVRMLMGRRRRDR